MMMKKYKNPFCCSRFSWARKRISSQISTIWARHLKKFRQPVCSRLLELTTTWHSVIPGGRPSKRDNSLWIVRDIAWERGRHVPAPDHAMCITIRYARFCTNSVRHALSANTWNSSCLPLKIALGMRFATAATCGCCTVLDTQTLQ
jgi:hypothetical protein